MVLSRSRRSSHSRRERPRVAVPVVSRLSSSHHLSQPQQEPPPPPRALMYPSRASGRRARSSSCVYPLRVSRSSSGVPPR